MNKNQEKIVRDMQIAGAPTVHTIDTKDATILINEGLVRNASVDPAPAEGSTAVNLTAKGRGFMGGAPEADETPTT